MVENITEAEETPWTTHRCSLVRLKRWAPIIEGWRLCLPAPFPARTRSKPALEVRTKAARKRSERRASSLEGMTEDQRRVHLEEERIVADGLAPVVGPGGYVLTGVEAELRWKMAAVASENTNEILGCYLGLGSVRESELGRGPRPGPSHRWLV